MRNFSTPALILSTQIQGENNRRVTIFSPTEGIFFATLYGGPKSKLRSLVSPMNSGIIYLYRDEAKNQTKITDFDVKNYHLSFRESLFKTYAAAFTTEILIKTKAAGAPSESWKILNGFLDGIELSDEDSSRLGLIRFLWRYLGLLGLKPNTAVCAICGLSLHSQKFSDESLSQRFNFSFSDNAFCCPECSNFEKGDFSVSKAAITYLEAISSLSPKEVRKIEVSGKTLNEMKQLSFALIEKICGSKLNSLETGIGIL